MKMTSLDSVVRHISTTVRSFQDQCIDDMWERSEAVQVAKYLGKRIGNTLEVVSAYLPADPKAYALGALLLACSPDLSNLGSSGERNDGGTDKGNSDAIGMTADG